MNPIKGANIGHTDQLSGLSKIADLIYFDGPLLSLFRNKAGDNFFYHWCDSDQHLNRWLVFNVSDKNLNDYLKRATTLRNLLLKPDGDFVYCIDIDENLNYESVFIVSPSELPPDYVPVVGSLYEDEPIVEKMHSTSQLKIPISGLWESDDFKRFPHLFRRSYAFFYTFLNKIDTDITLPMRDGWSSMHLFDGFMGLVPDELFPKLEAVQYASPGAIVFKADPSVSRHLLASLNAISINRKKAQATYDFLHKYLADHLLLGKDTSDLNVEPHIASFIAKQSIILAEELMIPNPNWITEISQNEVQSAKIMLAYFRLCDRILAYESDKRVFFPLL